LAPFAGLVPRYAQSACPVLPLKRLAAEKNATYCAPVSSGTDPVLIEKV